MFSIYLCAYFKGCGRYAGGQGYNSIGHFCGGWAGNCGDGGIGGSTWYLVWPLAACAVPRAPPRGPAAGRRPARLSFRGAALQPVPFS